MGCDGGTIPTRDELVRLKKKPEQKDKDSERLFRWQHCALSQETLEAPIVACELGRLYKKDAIIEALLDQSNNKPEIISHIRGLKDVKELRLTDNPAFAKNKQGPDKGDAYVDRQIAHYICPVAGLEMNGKYKFCFWWSCGCVFSERATKEVKSAICHSCGISVNDEDLIILNGSEDDIDRLRDNMEARRARAKAEKKAKRQSKKDKDEEPLAKKQKEKTDDHVIKNGNGKQSTKLQDPSLVKSKGSYSVVKDPNASDVFKSIFTSHHTAQNRQRAHWVTYNPHFN